jgi:hypothetical protein
MTDEGRVRELLLRWQQSLARGREEPVEELCHDRPDLADELRRRINILRRMSDFVHRLQSGTPDNPLPAPRTGAPTLPGDEVRAELDRRPRKDSRRWRTVALGLLIAAVGCVAGFLLSGRLALGGRAIRPRQQARSPPAARRSHEPGGRCGRTAARAIRGRTFLRPASRRHPAPVARWTLDCSVTGVTFVGDGKQFACRK